MGDNTQKTSGFGIGEAGRVPASDLESEMEAERLQPHRVRGQMVRCDCGHMCPRNLVMSASLGTCCPGCYDRMSDEW